MPRQLAWSRTEVALEWDFPGIPNPISQIGNPTKTPPLEQGWNLAAPQSTDETTALSNAIAAIPDFGKGDYDLSDLRLFWIGFRNNSDAWESFDISEQI